MRVQRFMGMCVLVLTACSSATSTTSSPSQTVISAPLALAATPSAAMTSVDLSASAAATPSALTASTTGLVREVADIRSLPSTTLGTSVGQIAAGTEVELWMRNADSSWFQVHTALGFNGWLPAYAMQIDPAVANNVPEGTIELPSAQPQ